MSNPKDIDQFDTQIKRTSDRLRGGSNSPPEIQDKDASPDDSTPQTNTGTAPTSSTNGASGQGRKGKTTGKKGPSPSGALKDANPGTSSAPNAGSTQLSQTATVGNAGGGSSSDPPSAPGTLASGGVAPEPPKGTSAGAQASAPGAQGSNLAPNPQPPTQVSNTTQAPSIQAVTAATATPSALIAPEIVNKTVMSNAQLTGTTSQAVQAKFMAGTNTILSRIEECSPDAIKSWLQSKGYSLVQIGPSVTSTEVSKSNEKDSLVTDSPTGIRPEPSNDGASSRPANAASAAPLAVPTPNAVTTAPSAEANTTPSQTEQSRKRPITSSLGPFDLTTEEDDPEPTKTTSTNVVKFSDEGIEAHGLVALPKYFAPKMAALNAYIPLTVFNPQWLRQDLLQQSIRSRSSFSNHNNFSSLPVYEGPGGSSSNTNDDRRNDYKNQRSRSRRGSWNGSRNFRDRSPQRRRFNGGEAWRRDSGREDRRGDDRDNSNAAGKAK
ncbi:uncharacterized protein MELLADRAFT_65501 [Melampsora larici-populina 98AG31]|uniref:Uncharacterized protein n=1 Tax=Melampsora larici-populina (strain 98AG31 / pathotype 3-4-7) TaxID=747676 RepID=F4RVN4_MELLP|nr:uncharacterized protein MELLADRAFT_65501 [Melampsora larici-populina 98AG31]EGG03551.1 hypothetical protein MELLADRAFT_65501 [Melampsora larici-populina 98AG31]